ncbi:hypothetical protein I79_012929 [Cricetulus griseus]|uniref:Uncharacterized protein n=1 Tax=Cricetulus griseus TaxID=10029 RepID=G3HQ37_CRIGR|nr:hypothetical protein I79_012929 [Cricetulus griseus]
MRYENIPQTKNAIVSAQSLHNIEIQSFISILEKYKQRSLQITRDMITLFSFIRF